MTRTALAALLLLTQGCVLSSLTGRLLEPAITVELTGTEWCMTDGPPELVLNLTGSVPSPVVLLDWWPPADVWESEPPVRVVDQPHRRSCGPSLLGPALVDAVAPAPPLEKHLEVFDGQRWRRVRSVTDAGRPPSLLRRAAFAVLIPFSLAADTVLFPVELLAQIGLWIADS